MKRKGGKGTGKEKETQIGKQRIRINEKGREKGTGTKKVKEMEKEAGNEREQ